MELKSSTEHIEQGLIEEAVRSSVDGAEKPKKKRSQIAKKGINRWNQDLLKRVLDTQERIECELRWVRHKLDQIGEADYSKEDLELYAVPDGVDREILQRLLEVGVGGALPKDLAAEVNRRGGYRLKYYDVARRLVRFNKKLNFSIELNIERMEFKKDGTYRFYHLRISMMMSSGFCAFALC